MNKQRHLNMQTCFYRRNLIANKDRIQKYGQHISRNYTQKTQPRYFQCLHLFPLFWKISSRRSRAITKPWPRLHFFHATIYDFDPRKSANLFPFQLSIKNPIRTIRAPTLTGHTNFIILIQNISLDTPFYCKICLHVSSKPIAQSTRKIKRSWPTRIVQLIFIVRQR